MAIVGISALRPDLVVLDEFSDSRTCFVLNRTTSLPIWPTGCSTTKIPRLAAPLELCCSLQRRTACTQPPTKSTATTMKTSSIPVRSCFRTRPGSTRLQRRFNALRGALFSRGSLGYAESICGDIGTQLRDVISRTERLAATPDRDGMLRELDAEVQVGPDDLRAYLRLGDLAEFVEHHEPTEYWKSGAVPRQLHGEVQAERSCRACHRRWPFGRRRSTTSRSWPPKLGRNRGISARRSAERTAPLAAPRLGAPPRLPAALDTSVDEVLRCGIGV